MISSISSFEITNAVVSELWIFFWITESVADAAVVNLNGIKMLLADDLSKYSHNGNPVFSNGPRRPARNSADFIILEVDFLIILYYLMHYLWKICKVTI